jgi:response regulator RpfG family c-di-GMP phosphodiesterase
MNQVRSDSNAQILIVEDSPLEAEMLRRCLDKAGYRTSLTNNGAQGLQSAHALHPALVVSDINMPVMNGYELCRTLKYDDELWNIPVILLTSLSEPENIIQAINAGTDSYITKPFVEANLLECVKSLLATPIRWRRSKEQRIEVVEYNGKRCAISGGGQQILSLMLSVYGNSLAQNQDLMQIQAQLNLLNDNLNEQVRVRTAELRQVLQETITAVLLTLEKRDPYDAKHQQRVDRLAAVIATELGLSQQQIESLRQHTLNGFEIAKDISLPWLVAQMLLQHQEGMDGCAYPHGLKNAQVRLEAHILAVADKLEAMMTFRPYRAAQGMDAAVEALTLGRGTLFDPAVVDACLRVVNKPGYAATG